MYESLSILPNVLAVQNVQSFYVCIARNRNYVMWIKIGENITLCVNFCQLFANNDSKKLYTPQFNI